MAHETATRLSDLSPRERALVRALFAADAAFDEVVTAPAAAELRIANDRKEGSAPQASIE